MKATTNPTPERQAFDALLNAYKGEWHYLTVEADTDEEMNASTQRLQNIENDMWQAAATDLETVLAKFEVAVRGGNTAPQEAVASILWDLRNLCGNPVSPIFQADLWLHEWETQGGSYLVRNGETLICGDPTNQRHVRLMRQLHDANGADAVKAMVRQCCRGLPEEVEA